MRDILTTSSNLLPDFNDKLLLEFRNNKIGKIKQYLNDLFGESVKLLNGRLKYVGYAELSPDERLEYIKSNVILNNKVEIQKSSFELVRYIFEFEGCQHFLYVHVPYLEHGSVWLGDTQYFPMFPIVERGGLHRTQKSIIIKVMRAPLTFKRVKTYTFGTDKGKLYKDIVVVTVKIHQRKTGRGSKRSDLTPLILYHLVKAPFYNVMKMYGLNEGDITLTNKYTPCDEYEYIKIKEDIFIKLKTGILDNPYNQRLIASYLVCLENYPRFELRELTAAHAAYYKTVLGKYTYPNLQNATQLHTNAQKHLETTDSLLDPPAQHQLSQIGIHATNIYELLLHVFFNIDMWIVDYNPIDLYDKKIGALDQIMAPLVSTINSKLFKLINNKDKELEQETIKRFVTTASRHEGWLLGNPAFRANPTIYNDNWLITIGSKRFRSLENTETTGSMGKGKKKKNIPMALLKAHPSHMVVESILALPASSPVITGEINPYCQIDEDGNIIKPVWANEIAHVFD